MRTACPFCFCQAVSIDVTWSWNKSAGEEHLRGQGFSHHPTIPMVLSIAQLLNLVSWINNQDSEEHHVQAYLQKQEYPGRGRYGDDQ
jgi:hypothetical protein